MEANRLGRKRKVCFKYADAQGEEEEDKVAPQALPAALLEKRDGAIVAASAERKKPRKEASHPLDYFALQASMKVEEQYLTVEEKAAASGKKEQLKYFQCGNIIGVCRFDDDASRQDAKSKSWGHSKWISGNAGWCYHVREGSVRTLQSPIPCTGSLGPFRLPTSVQEKLIEQIPELEGKEIRGLSLRQPHANRILAGEKDVENRTKRIFQTVRTYGQAADRESARASLDADHVC